MSGDNPIKILEITGRIERYTLDRKKSWTQEQFLQTEYFDFSRGLWKVCVKDLMYKSDRGASYDHDKDTEAWYEKYFSVSINFVQGQFSQDLNRSSIPLANFRYQEWGTQMVTFTPIWFELNNASRHLIIDVTPRSSLFDIAFDGRLMNPFNFVLTLMFQRVK